MDFGTGDLMGCLHFGRKAKPSPVWGSSLGTERFWEFLYWDDPTSWCMGGCGCVPSNVLYMDAGYG